MSVRPIRQNGRVVAYQADVSDKRRGIRRTKRTFRGKDARRQARQWAAAVREQAHQRLVDGGRARRFGEALDRYLDEVSPYKRSSADDHSNAEALRWPVWHNGAWVSLMDAPLDDGPDGVVAVLATWSAEQRAVRRRVALDGRRYHQRPGHQPGAPDRGLLAWWCQPAGWPTPARWRVSDPALNVRLESAGGRGPWASNTLRTKQLLARRVLDLARRSWRWINADLAGLVELAGASRHVDDALPSYEALRDLVIHAPMHFDHAILAGAWIGWRRGNLLGNAARDIPPLMWDRVVFPSAGRPGCLVAERTKNGEAQILPMSSRTEGLLRLRWELRRGAVVFHRGDGEAWGDTRRLWDRAKADAGVDPAIRWHGLRHTFATELAERGLSDREIMALGNWKSRQMVDRYAASRLDHLHAALEAAGGAQ